MPPESRRFYVLGLGKEGDQNGYLWQKVKGKFSAELRKLCLASSGRPSLAGALALRFWSPQR